MMPDAVLANRHRSVQMARGGPAKPEASQLDGALGLGLAPEPFRRKRARFARADQGTAGRLRRRPSLAEGLDAVLSPPLPTPFQPAPKSS